MKKRILAMLLAIVMVIGMVPVQAFASETEPVETVEEVIETTAAPVTEAAEEQSASEWSSAELIGDSAEPAMAAAEADVPVSVTADGTAVAVSYQGNFYETQWGSSTIPVYYAQVPEDATISITCGGDAYITKDYVELADLQGLTKDSLQTYFTTASTYNLDTTNSVAYIELLDYYYGSVYGVLIELEPAAATTYAVTLPTGEGYTAAAYGDSVSPVAAGGSYSFTVTVSDDYDGTNMVVKANDTELTADNGVYTIENISAAQNVTVTGVEKKAPFISVTADGTECELTTIGTFVSSAADKTNEITVYMVSANEGAAIVINKLADDGGDAATVNDTNARSLFTYGGAASRGSYPVTVDSSYAAGDEAKEKFGLTTSNTVYYVEVGGLTTRTPLYGLLVEVIPVTYAVTLPTGDGYTAAASGDSASPVAAGGSYSFTVTVADDYDGTNMVVKANDTVLTADNGVYTIENISEDQIITVTGVEKKAVPLISVTVGGTETELTTLGTYQSSVSGNKTEIPVYMVSADEGAAVAIQKGANGDGGSGSYRRAWKYGASSGNWDEATYPVTVGSGYAVNDTAKEYFDLTTTNTVYYVEIGGYSDGTPLYGLLVEVIPAAVTTYTVTLPTGDGYTAAAYGESASPVAAGGSYSFTVTVADDYDGTNMAVKANDTVLTADNGVYTIENISADQTVTVTGVEPNTVSPGESSVKLTGITGVASSTNETEDADVSNAFDGDDSTYWATAAGGSLTDAYLIAQLGSTYTINKVEYTKRYDSNAGYNCTGNLLNYVIEVSTDGATWIQVAEGETIDGTTVIEFESVQAAYVRLTSTSSYHWDDAQSNTVMCAAELAVFKTEGDDTDTPTPTSCTVTLPTGEGYTAAAYGESASPVAAGGSYSFTVAIVYGYDSSAMVVKANGIELIAENGVYTIENIRADQTVTVTGVTKTVQTDYSDYITVSVEKYDADGNCTFLLAPTRNDYDQYVNKYVIDALRKAVGGSQYSDKVGYASDYADGVSTYYITKVYDETQSDSYLDNGDLEGYKWQVLVDNEPWEGSYYVKDYALTGGEVLRCIYTNVAAESLAERTSKDTLIQLAAEVSADVQKTEAYQDALNTIVSETASETDVQNAITALQNAAVVNATSVEITAGESVDLKVNESLTLQAAVLPANATDVPVWSSSDSAIVSVDAASGQITGVSAGTATVTVTCGTATDTITVNVTAVAAESVTITNGDVTLEARFSVQLEATVLPETSTELVTWSVADENIATVDANGKLTGVSEGETTVTATAGTVSHTVKVTVNATTSSYVYFQYSDGSVQEMKDDSFTLTVLDEGCFMVGNTTAAATWSCSEYVSAGGNEMQYNYWINSDGKYQPHGVKEMTATVNAGGFYKTFTINTVSSGISQIKTYIGDEEKNADNPYEVTGMVSGVPVTVQGLNADGDWVYVPTQAVQITSSDTNIARFVGNQMSLIFEGSAEITVSMLDNSEVSSSFKAICNTVKVTAIDVHVPETFVIDTWDSMGGVFVGIYKGYENPDTQYYINYTPSNATNQNVTWESLTPEIAEYDEGWSTGIVPKKAGTAKFIVTSQSNPEVSQEVSINFAYKTPLESAVSAQETYELSVGESLDPGLTFTPSNATETRFTWTYSQDGIVEVKDTVSSAGYDRVVSRKIKALANGTVTVTGTPVDDTADCNNVVFTVKVSGSADTEEIDYLQMAKDDIAHGLEYLKNQSMAAYGNEWTIFTNLRAGGSIDEQTKITYLKSVKAALDSNEITKPTDYVRLVLTLTLLGQDPENFEGYNLIEKLYNGSLSNQTSNQICFTLLALDSRNYEIPETAQWDRDALIDKILTFQATDGGFGLSVGDSGDVDMTGMILQSLAPYYNSSYPQVQSAVDKALEYLKGQLSENVGYIVGGGENSCTTAQVLTALAALKIDPTDPENGFTFGTKNLITNLSSFKQESGFAYLLAEGYGTNLMGTQQTTYALEAYRRYAEGKKALYDLTDLDGDTEIEESITVNFSLLGDDVHKDGETAVHTLAGGNLKIWVEAQNYEVAKDSTVKDVLDTVLSQNGMTCSNPTGNYVVSIEKDGVSVGEFTNGSLSGWMYTLNGVHPNLGVAEQKLQDGDVIVFHYTDDYVYEYNKPIANKVIELIDAIGEVTLESEENIAAVREAYDNLTEAQQKLVTNYETLIRAEGTLELLKAPEEDRNAVTSVIELIDAIELPVYLYDETIKAARDAYEALEDNQKSLVFNYDVLVMAEEELEQIRSEKLVSRKSVTLKAYDAEGNAVKSNKVIWSLAEKYAPYASITKAGKLTAKKVVEKVTVYAVAVDAADGETVVEAVRADIYPAVSQVEIMDQTGAKVNSKTVNLKINNGSDETIRLTGGVYPAGAMEDVTWTVSDKKGAYVTYEIDGNDIVIKPVENAKKGTVTVTAVSTDGSNKKATVKISVSVLVEDLEVTCTTGMTVASGKSITLKAAPTNTNATNKAVTWSVVEGSEYASISNSGKLTAVKDLTTVQTVVVRASAKDGGPAFKDVEVKITPLALGVQMYFKVPDYNVFGVCSNVTKTVNMTQDPELILKTAVYPYDDANQSVTWKSSSPKIASLSVDENGHATVTCLKAGKVTITATADDGSKEKATFTLNIVEGIESLTLTDQVIAVKKSLNLAKLITINPTTATNKKLTWSIVGDAKGATLSASGALNTSKVDVSEGPVEIKVSAAAQDGWGAEPAVCTVTVYPATTKVTLLSGGEAVTGTLELEVGESLTLEGYCEGAANVYTWTSGNKNVSVEDGVVTASEEAVGKTVTITCTAADGTNKKATVKVKIIAPEAAE